jgi:hypothetical protein
MKASVSIRSREAFISGANRVKFSRIENMLYENRIDYINDLSTLSLCKTLLLKML